MANPVINRINQEFSKSSKTPAGYPTMPGYTPGASGYTNYQAPGQPTYDTAPQPYAGQASPYGSPYGQQPTPQQMQQLQQSWQAPALDANAAGLMTYDDVITKTGILLGLLVIAGAVNWTLFGFAPGITVILGMVGLFAGLVLVFVNVFKKQISPALIMAYAAMEGLALGFISVVAERMYPGVVVQALLATAAVFAVTLVLYKSGKVRYSAKMAKFTLISLVGIILYSILSMVLVSTGVIANPFGLDSVRVMGIPLGIIVGLFAVLVGVFCLIGDFEVAHQGVVTHQPKVMAWYCAFGITITVVWLYLEILRMLELLRN